MRNGRLSIRLTDFVPGEPGSRLHSREVTLPSGSSRGDIRQFKRSAPRASHFHHLGCAPAPRANPNEVVDPSVCPALGTLECVAIENAIGDFRLDLLKSCLESRDADRTYQLLREEGCHRIQVSRDHAGATRHSCYTRRSSSAERV